MRMTWIAAMFAVTACNGDGQTLTTKSEEVSVVAKLKNVKHENYGDLVRAQLLITGAKGTLVAADLDCVAIRIGQSRSKNIYVDSYVDTLTGRYPASNGKISVAVYWSMANFSAGTNADLRTAALEITSKENRPCFVLQETTGTAGG